MLKLQFLQIVVQLNCIFFQRSAELLAQIILSNFAISLLKSHHPLLYKAHYFFR